MKRKRQERENPGLQGVRILFMLFIFTIGLSVGMPFGRAGKADSDPKPVKEITGLGSEFIQNPIVPNLTDDA